MRRNSPFKSIIAIFIAAVIGFFLPFSAMRSPIKADAASGSTKVYITEYGEKYHSYSCQYLRQSCIAISLSRAVERGYTRCSVCNPPRLTSDGGSGSTSPSTPSTPSYQGGGSNSSWDEERWIPLFWAAVCIVVLICLIVKWVKEDRELKRLEQEEQDDTDEENEDDELD